MFITPDLDCTSEKQIHEKKSICYVEDKDEVQDKQEADVPIKPTIPLSDIDVWLQSVKSAILNLTKINQARVKRDVNAILSKYEILEIEELQNVTNDAT